MPVAIACNPIHSSTSRALINADAFEAPDAAVQSFRSTYFSHAARYGTLGNLIDLAANCLAKSSGQNIVTHSAEVRAVSEEELKPLCRSLEARYRSFFNLDLFALARTSADIHDIGKSHIKWQTAAKANALHLCGMRHEQASLVSYFTAAKRPSFAVAVAVGAHHGHFGHDDSEIWDGAAGSLGNQIRPFFSFVSAIGQRIVESQSVHNATLMRLRVDPIRSLLAISDKIASARECGVTFRLPTTFEYEFPHSTKRGLQKEHRELSDHLMKPNSLLFIRQAPGTGKTDLVKLMAADLIKAGRVDRLVVLLPSRLMINGAVESDGRGRLEVIGQHSDIARNIEDWIASEISAGRTPPASLWDMARIAKMFLVPITFTTIEYAMQVCSGERELDHVAFPYLMNALVVLDEADAYGSYTLKGMEDMMQTFRTANVPVVVMSGSLPSCEVNRYIEQGWDVLQRDSTEGLDKRIEVIRAGEAHMPSDAESCLREALDRDYPQAVIYANTPDRAIAYANWVAKEYPKLPLKVCHRKFRGENRRKIERKITEMLGAKAWTAYRNGTGPHPTGVVILTQAGEASINISAERMISDLAPVNRLFNRAGRLLRRFSDTVVGGDGIGKLYIIDPKDAQGQSYPAPYGSFAYGRWEAEGSLKRTSLILKDGIYNGFDFMQMIDRAIPAILPPSVEECRNSAAYRRSIITNAVLTASRVPVAVGDDRAADKKDWSSVQDQDVTVYAMAPNSRVPESFDSFYRFKRWAEDNKIPVRVGYCAQMLRASAADEFSVSIAGTPAKIVVVRPEYYDPERGVTYRRKK